MNQRLEFSAELNYTPPSFSCEFELIRTENPFESMTSTAQSGAEKQNPPIAIGERRSISSRDP